MSINTGINVYHAIYTDGRSEYVALSTDRNLVDGRCLSEDSQHPGHDYTKAGMIDFKRVCYLRIDDAPGVMEAIAKCLTRHEIDKVI